MCDNRSGARLNLLVLIGFIATISSCAAPKFLSWRMETRGYLGDYTTLTPGAEGELPRIRRAPKFSANRHTRFLVESPTVWRSDQAPLGEVSRSDLTDTAKALEDRVRAQFSRRFRVVHAPAEGVLRLRLAFTEEAKAWVVADTYTRASRGRTPRAFRRSEHMSAAAVAFAAHARIECQVSNAETGELLLEGQSGPVVADGKREGATSEIVTKGFDRVAERLAQSLEPNADPGETK